MVNERIEKNARRESRDCMRTTLVLRTRLRLVTANLAQHWSREITTDGKITSLSELCGCVGITDFASPITATHADYLKALI
jgi:hypothetical protein